MGKSCNSTSISKETCEVTHRSNPEEPEDRGYRVGSATTTQHTTRPEATAQYPTEDHERIPREKKPSITAEYRTNIIRMGRLPNCNLQVDLKFTDPKVCEATFVEHVLTTYLQTPKWTWGACAKTHPQKLKGE
ncbi:hypothetical protein PGT21_026970 [Puccinia graminis f. sp. tritici]|uniref:Uncharacterized protein n=1 Tax=Puccinia graminis f. sp. tritici TaxID=56615 RepID=A0A5B0N3M1_PUCGR|nr:hypothetical protein PGT21_026970 [Puccinia graminis f. sp. tritici]